MEKRGQASMEYILVAALVLLILLPTTYFFMKNTQRQSTELSLSKLDKLGRMIVTNAETVFFQGIPAKLTLEGDIPDNVVDILILNNWTTTPEINQLIFIYRSEGKEQELVYDSRVNINGSFNQRSWSQGHKTIVLTANKTSNGIPFVWVEIK